jgi:hypothetical protein
VSKCFIHENICWYCHINSRLPILDVLQMTSGSQDAGDDVVRLQYVVLQSVYPCTVPCTILM